MKDTDGISFFPLFLWQYQQQISHFLSKANHLNVQETCLCASAADINSSKSLLQPPSFEHELIFCSHLLSLSFARMAHSFTSIHFFSFSSFGQGFFKVKGLSALS